MQASTFKNSLHKILSYLLYIYVDNCILVSNTITLIEHVETLLSKEFNMSYEGDIHYTLGNSILRNRQEGWTFIHQQKYLTNKLEEYNMINSKPLATSMQSGIHLSKEVPTQSQDRHILYPQIIGSLMHAIVNTRRDCAYAISSLAQY